MQHLEMNETQLENCNITLNGCSVLNPATLFPHTRCGQHDCEAATSEMFSLRLDLQEKPLVHPDMELFVCFWMKQLVKTGKNEEGYAIMTLFYTLFVEP